MTAKLERERGRYELSDWGLAMNKVACLLILTGCGKMSSKHPADPQEDATDPIVQEFDEASARLDSGFLADGWVVSRDSNKAPQHAGDSLLWTGLWIGAAKCDQAQESETALQEMIRKHDGGLTRYRDDQPEFQEYKGGREVTFDGAIGLYVGVAQRVTRCPETIPSWLDVMTIHKEFLDAHHGRLNANVDAGVPPGFDLVFDLLMARLSGDSDPSDVHKRIGVLMGEASSLGASANASHSPAYRVHLALIAIQALETMGQLIPESYRSGPLGFCAMTRGINMPTLDHWCGRSDVKDWIAQFKYDEWEFRHQRSGSWEKPDGQGFETPGLDLLVGIRQGYAF